MGQQVLAVSDPVNEGQMLSLEQQPSKMALIRAMNMRNYPEIEMVFSSELSPVASKIIDGAGRKGYTLKTGTSVHVLDYVGHECPRFCMAAV